VTDDPVFECFRKVECRDLEWMLAGLRGRPAGRSRIDLKVHIDLQPAEEWSVGIALSQTDDSSLIRLEGAVDISVAAELKAVLLRAIAKGNTIRISADAVSELDVTAFQLLWAACREAKRSGMNLVLAGETPEPVEKALSEVGLDARALFACACEAVAEGAGPEVP
jgi:anti-anti-sigma factor